MCSWSISPHMQTVWLKMCVLSGFRKIWTGTAPANIWKCLECELFMFAFDMWVSGIKDLLKQITSKYWHQADCLIHNLNFCMAHFLFQCAPSDGLLAYIFLICKWSWLRFVDILRNMTNSFNGFVWSTLTLTECLLDCAQLCVLPLLYLPQIMVVLYLLFKVMLCAALHHLTVSLHHITLSIHGVFFCCRCCSKLPPHLPLHSLIQLYIACNEHNV